MHTLCKYLHAKRRTKQASWLADPSHTPGRKLRVQQRVMILYDKTSTLTKHVSMFRLCRQNTRTKQRLHKWPAAPAMCWQRSPRCLKDFRQAHEHNFVTLCVVSLTSCGRRVGGRIDQHNAAIGSGKSAQTTHERQHRLCVVLHWFCIGSARRVYRMKSEKMTA